MTPDDIKGRTKTAMKHGDFAIGLEFFCHPGLWRCTDVGTRAIAAIRIDQVKIGSTKEKLARTLDRDEAEAEGWFRGPPYPVAERVFDEDDIVGCLPVHKRSE